MKHDLLVLWSFGCWHLCFHKIRHKVGPFRWNGSFDVFFAPPSTEKILCVFFSLFADKRRSMSNGAEGGKQQKAVYNPEEHEHGLLPVPLHFGRYMREKRINFQLPYDLWWLGENDLVSTDLLLWFSFFSKAFVACR